MRGKGVKGGAREREGRGGREAGAGGGCGNIETWNERKQKVYWLIKRLL